MLIVDTHCHAGLSWFEPVEMLIHQMGLNGVEKAALIQHRGCYDNTYLLECAAKSPGRFAVVVLVDVSREDAPQRLEEWAARGAAGLRLMAMDRSLGPDGLAMWRKASDLGLVVSTLGVVEQFASDEFNRLVSQVPDLTVIIEHLAGMKPGSQAPYEAYKRALALASYPNTYMKIGGLGEISVRPSNLGDSLAFDDTPPLIEMALEAFGPERMMWGSDYPPVSSREGYGNALRGVMEHPALSDPRDREWVMGKTAAKVFKFS